MNRDRLCCHCKHGMPAITVEYWKCDLVLRVSVVDGKTVIPDPTELQYCELRRRVNTGCGPEGKEWEPILDMIPSEAKESPATSSGEST